MAGAEKKAGGARDRGGIQSLERAAAILEVVAGRPGGVTLGEICAETGLHTSTAFHLIKTMVGLGFVAQAENSKRYRIGGRVFALAAGALNEATLLALATPVLERLSADTGDAAHLAVRSNGEITLVARTAAAGMLQMAERAGATRPAHATAIGKMLLAAMDPADLERLLADLPLPRLTPETITDRDALRREIAEARRAGIAHDRREMDRDVCCIAMPVRDFAGRCIAAIGISGPAWRMRAEDLTAKEARLGAAAAELSGLLGYREAEEAAG